MSFFLITIILIFFYRLFKPQQQSPGTVVLVL
jgi:preprotein translocase subunit YajC